MLSVTERVYKIKQPRGGYLNKKEFTHINFRMTVSP